MLLSHSSTATAAPCPQAIASQQPQRSPQTARSSISRSLPATGCARFSFSQSKQGLGASPSRGPRSPAASMTWLGERDCFPRQPRVVGATFKMANEKRAASGPREPRWSWRLPKLVHLVRRELGFAGIAGNNSNLCSSVARFFFSNHQIIPREEKKKKREKGNRKSNIGTRVFNPPCVPRDIQGLFPPFNSLLRSIRASSR